jgi:S-adenosylmethionine:tRNA ribosyltransferase-isomerase
MSPAGAEDPLAILDAYDFELPEARIAQSPMAERDASRLMVLDRGTGKILEAEASHCMRDLPTWLNPGDLLVINSTRVRSARLVGQKASGGSAEALLLRPVTDPSTAGDDRDGQGSRHRALVKCTGRIREGLGLRFGPALELSATIVAIHERGEVTLLFQPNNDPYAYGEAPLPPYIRRNEKDSSETDLERYQTIYAREPGAVAAPTAGLHFNERLFRRLRESGVAVAEVVLHVGAGTFRPLDERAISTGRLHPEDFVLPTETVDAIEKTQSSGGRIIAVGTTTARVLESQVASNGQLTAGSGTTDLFIRPGGRPFQVIDALLTNFHLPRSSLLLLVAEFAGRRELLDAYAYAIEHGFRFYSYGDAMLILTHDGNRKTMKKGPDVG